MRFRRRYIVQVLAICQPTGVHIILRRCYMLQTGLISVDAVSCETWDVGFPGEVISPVGDLLAEQRVR